MVHHSQNFNLVPVEVVDDAIWRFEDVTHILVLIVWHHAPAAGCNDKLCSTIQQPGDLVI